MYIGPAAGTNPQGPPSPFASRYRKAEQIQAALFLRGHAQQRFSDKSIKDKIVSTKGNARRGIEALRVLGLHVPQANRYVILENEAPRFKRKDLFLPGRLVVEASQTGGLGREGFLGSIAARQAFEVDEECRIVWLPAHHDELDAEATVPEQLRTIAGMIENGEPLEPLRTASMLDELHTLRPVSL